MRKKSAKSKSEEKTHKHSRRRRKSSSSESGAESSEIQDEQTEESKTRRTRKITEKEPENNTAVGGRVTRHSRRLAAISATSDEVKESTPELLSPAKTGKSSPYSSGSPVKDSRKKDGTPDKHKAKDCKVWTVESANGSGLQKLKISLRRHVSPEPSTVGDSGEASNDTQVENDKSEQLVEETSKITSEMNIDLESIALPEANENVVVDIQLPPTEAMETDATSQPAVETLPDMTSQIAEDFVEIENIELPPEPEPQPVIKDVEESKKTKENLETRETVSEISLPNEEAPEEIPLPNDTSVVKPVDKIIEDNVEESQNTEHDDLIEKTSEIAVAESITNSEIVSSPQQALSEQEDGSQTELVLTFEDNVMEERTTDTANKEDESAPSLKEEKDTQESRSLKKESVLPKISRVELEEVYDYEHDDTREEGELSANEAMSPIHEVFKKLPAEERKRSWGICNVFHFNRTKLVANERSLKEHNIVKRVINKDDLESSESEDLVFVKEIREENIIHDVENDTNSISLREKELGEISHNEDSGDGRRRRTLESDKIKDKPSKRYSKESKMVSSEGKTVLYITNLVRPFTVTQLRELLQRTGRIVEDGFWMDSIKSKCYVQFENSDQAEETRHALHGIRWPVNNPKVLSVHFATPEDLVVAQERAHDSEAPSKAEPLVVSNHTNNEVPQKSIDWKKHFEQYDERPRKVRDVREWDIGKPAHPDEMMYMDENELKKKEDADSAGKSKRDRDRERKRKADMSDDDSRAKRYKKSVNNTQPQKEAKLLDDLFRRTKASPSVYWLPLSEEQIAVKQEARRKNLEDVDKQIKNRSDRDPRRRDREPRRSRR